MSKRAALCVACLGKNALDLPNSISKTIVSQGSWNVESELNWIPKSSFGKRREQASCFNLKNIASSRTASFPRFGF